ncbi:DNA replication complex GINS protein PSF2 [Daktulosphaira vitifoliae]|uniref:DNA replication complex GINS protein PSF2 n=1 Tax=Daktulosphaira vitifoliae TaxID=58002 RepID=UPI0021A9E638|nr:DNA replication complex GINS protein PSF2 [Daktulosphaira vitifoliae]
MMHPSEIEYMAENEVIQIVPNFNNASHIHLICGSFGPFRAGLPSRVPIWAALNLRQKKICRILPPDWMNVEKLNEKIEEEKSSKFFTQLPSNYYLEITQMLLAVANEDIPKANEIKTAVKDLWDLRIAKLRSSVDMFIKDGRVQASLNHLTPMEINSVRPVFPDTLDALMTLHEHINSNDDRESSQSTRATPSTSSLNFSM